MNNESHPLVFPVKLFAYGSLRKGGYLNSLLQNSNFITEAWTAPSYTLYGLRYPWLIVEGTTTIYGEIYSISEKIFNEIETIEINSGYKRTFVSLNSHKGCHLAIAYTYPKELVERLKIKGAIEITSGDFIKWKDNRKGAINN